MLNLWTFKLLAVLALFVAPVRSLNCYECEYNTAKDKPICNVTVKTCESNQAYCFEKTLVDQKNFKLYGKNCAAEDSCGNPDEACAKEKKSKNLKSCSIKCCQGNLCVPNNPANVVTPFGMLLFMMAGFYCIFV